MFNFIINLYAELLLAIPMGMILYGILNVIFDCEYRNEFKESQEYKEIQKDFEEIKTEIKNLFKSN